MAWVLDRRYAARVRPGRRPVQRGGCPAPEKLVRALFVVEDAEPVEGVYFGFTIFRMAPPLALLAVTPYVLLTVYLIVAAFLAGQLGRAE